MTSEEYNTRYFYSRFHTKVPWLIIVMIFCLIFNDAAFAIPLILIYMCYGLYKEFIILTEINNKKNGKK